MFNHECTYIKSDRDRDHDRDHDRDRDRDQNIVLF